MQYLRKRLHSSKRHPRPKQRAFRSITAFQRFCSDMSRRTFFTKALILNRASFCTPAPAWQRPIVRHCQSSSSSFLIAQDHSKRKLKQRVQPFDVHLDDGDGVCAAYCVENPVSLPLVANFFKSSNFSAKKKNSSMIFKPKNLQTVAGDVVHVLLQASDQETVHFGHAFFFSSGAAVFWGLPLCLRGSLLEELSKFQERNQRTLGTHIRSDKSSFPLSMDDFDHEFKYTIDEKRNRPTFRHDEIHLVDFSDREQLLAFSYGLAQSARLLVYEAVIDSLVLRTRTLPDELARDGEIKLSHRELKRLIGELLAARYSLNLVSDIMDTPEYFWQHPELQALHLECSREVELRSRAKILDARTETIKDALDILNNELSSSSSDRVERAILFLIAVEVVLELGRILPFAFR